MTDGERELPEGWVKSRIKDLLEINYGKGLTESDRDNSGQFPVYGSNGIVGTHSTALVEGPCLIIGRKGAAGVVHLSQGACWPIDTTYWTKAPQEFSVKYLYYVLSHINLRTLDKSTAVPSLSRNDIYAQTIPVPPKIEQERIVAKIEELLTRLDAGVAALKRVQAALKRYRAAVLKAACEGRLVPQDPNDEPAEKLLERILAERRAKGGEDLRAKGKDTKKAKYEEPKEPDTEGLPDLPPGWVNTYLDPLLSSGRKGITTGPFGSLLKKHEHRSQGVPVLGIDNIEPMRFVSGSKIHISSDKARQLAKYDVHAGDVLISRSGTVGEVCVVPDFVGDARISTNVMRVVLANVGMLPKFFSLVFNGSPAILAQVSELCSGSTRDFLNQGILRSLVFALPPIEEQQRITTEVDYMLSMVRELEQAVSVNLARAERLRQAILRRAFEGRLVPQ